MTPTLTTPPRHGAVRLRWSVASVLTAAVVAATLTLAGPAGPANAQIDAGDVSPTRSVGGVVVEVITETAAVLRGTEALAFTYQKIEWLIGPPPSTGTQAAPEPMLVPDDNDRRRLVEALGSESVPKLWCRGAGIIASSTEGTTNDLMTMISEDATSSCAGTGGGMIVSHGRVAMLLCVDTRVIASPTATHAFIPGGSVVSAAITGGGNDTGDAGPIVVGPPTDGVNDTSVTSWCPDPSGGAAESQTAATPVVFVCPTNDVIASSTEGTTNDIIASSTQGASNDIIASSTQGASSDLWDPRAGGSDTLRCPGTAEQVEELVASTGGADPLAGLRSMLHAYRNTLGHDDEPSSMTSIVRLLVAAPELGDLAAALGHARLDGAFDVEILAAVGGGARGWADLDDVELRSVLGQVEVLSVQLDDWYSGLTASTHRFKVEIEGVSAAWQPWLDARSTSPRLFDEADALFGTRAVPAEPGATRPTGPDSTDSEPATPPAPRQTTTTTPRPTATTTTPRPTTTTPRPTTTTPRPTTTTTPRPTTTTTPRPTTTTTTPPRPTTTTPRPTTTVAPQRPTTTAGR